MVLLGRHNSFQEDKVQIVTFCVCVMFFLVTTYLMNEFLIIIDIALHSYLSNTSLARETGTSTIRTLFTLLWFPLLYTMDRMGPTSGRGGNDPINIRVCITKVMKPLMIIIPIIVMVTIILIKVQNNCHKPIQTL